MTESDILLPSPTGPIDAVLFRPDGAPRRPAVLHLPDVGGPRESHRAMARRLAARGRLVLLPNPFHRTGRPPMMKFPANFSDPATRARFQELAAPLTPAVQEADAGFFVDALSTEAGGAPVAAVGHCFTGAQALRAAAARPERVVAAASFHGGRLVVEGADSPHRLLPRVRARLYFGHASNDATMPAESIAALEGSLREWGGEFRSETYPARHGWTVADHETFDPAQAERAFAALTALLDAAA